MERDPKFTLLIGTLLALAGCSGNNVLGTGGSAGAAGSGGSAGEGGAGGSDGDPGTPALASLDGTPEYAVVSTDYSSTSIAMLDAEFAVIDESWINSGTTFAGLVATLSGDVVLPTRQAGDGTFAIVDRYATDVVSRFYVPSGNLNGQVRTHGDPGETGYSSNPQDFVFVDEASAWAVRYEPNLDESAPEENQGTDLIEIDPSDMSKTGARFDLSVFNTVGTVMGEGGSADVEVFARPSRALLVGSKIVVGLERISAGFDAAGSGMVAIVDLEDNSALGIGIGELQNCGRVVPVPGSPGKLAVGCLGFSFPYGDEAQVRASAGIAVLDVRASGVTIDRIWRVADDAESAIAVSNFIAIDDEHVLGVANPNFVTSFVDQLVLTDLSTGAQSVVRESGGSFAIGVSAYDPDSEMLYVPDSEANAVIEYGVDESGFSELGSISITPSLPPAAVHLLD